MIADASSAQDVLIEEGETFYYAERLFNDGLYDLAALQYQRFADHYPLSPRAPEAAFRVGECYFKLSDYSKALQRFQYFILLFPESVLLDRAQFQIGTCFAQLKQYRNAAESFRRVAIFRPRSELAPEALVSASRNYLMDGNFSDSKEVLFTLLEKYPTSSQRFEARLLLARGYTLQDHLDQALTELDKLTGEKISDALSSETQYDRARILEKRARFVQAEEIYNRLLASNLKNEFVIKAAIQLAQLRTLQNDHPGAITALKSILPFMSADYNDAVFILLGDCYYHLNSYREALDTFRKLEPSADNWLNYRKAMTYFKLGNADSATVVLASLTNVSDSLINRAPDQIIAMANLYIEALKQMGLAREAVNFGRAITARLGWRPGADQLYYKTAALVQKDLQNPRAALRLLRVLAEQFPDSPLTADAQYKIASIHFELGEYNSALSEFEQYLTLYPGADHHATARQIVRIFKSMQFSQSQAHETNLTGSSLSTIQFTGDNAALNIANIQFSLIHNYGMALWYYQQALQQEGSGSVRDQILFRIAQCYGFLAVNAKFSDQKKLAAGYMDSLITITSSLVKQYPASSFTREAKNQALQIIFDADSSDFDAVELEILRGKLLAPSDSLAPEHYLFEALRALHITESQSDRVILSEALQHLLKAKESLTENWMLAHIHHGLAHIYMKLDQESPALAELNELVQKYPHEPLISRAYYDLAKMEHQAGHSNAARNACQTIRKRFFYSTIADSASQLLVQILRASGETDQALQLLQQLKDRKSEVFGPLSLDMNESAARLFWQFAQTYQSAGDHQKMVEYCVRYLQVCPECAHSAHVLFILGENAFARKRYDDARDFYLNLETSFPLDTLGALAGIKIGDLLFEKEQYDEARKKYLAAPIVLSEFTRKHARYRATACLIRMGKVEAGEKEIELFNRDFNDATLQARLLYELGDQQLTLKNFNNAEKIFKQITRMQKETPIAGLGELGLGKLLLITNKTDQALETLSRIPEKYTDAEIVALALMNLGDYYLQNRQIQNALVVFKKAEQFKVKPDIQMAIARFLIRCYNDLGLWDQAIAQTRDYIDRYPDAEDLFDKKINIGLLMLRLNEYERAVSYLQDLKRLASREAEPEIQYHIGEAYLNMGRFEEAISEFLKVKYLCLPTKLAWDVTAFYQAGMIYMKLERYDRARQIFEQLAREQGPTSDFGRVAIQKIDQINKLLQQQPPAKS